MCSGVPPPLLAAVPGRVQAAPSSSAENTITAATLLFVKLQHRHERLLGDLDRADAFHAPLPFFLLLEEFALACHVAAIAFGQHILAHRRDRLARDDLPADRRLERDLVELPRDYRLELLDQAAALELGLASVCDERQRVNRLAGHEHVELHELAFAETDHLVVHRRVALGARLQLVVEVVDDLAERNLVLEDDAIAGPMLEMLEGSAPVLAELHHRADVRGRDDDRQLHEWLR